MYICAPYVSNAYGGLKRAFDPLELEVQMLISCHVMLETVPGSSARAATVLHHCNLSLFLIV